MPEGHKKIEVDETMPVKKLVGATPEQTSAMVSPTK